MKRDNSKQNKKIAENKFNDSVEKYTGIKINQLTIIEILPSTKDGIMALARCDCGNELVRPISRIRSNRIKSCASCGKKRQGEFIKKLADKKGRRHIRLTEIFHGMKTRCYNKNSKSYKNYGGRGIFICEEWKDNKIAFQEWALKNGYSDEYSLDRIDNDKEYSPENCRWATRREQTLNSRVRIDSTTKKRCVTPIRGKYQLTIDGKYCGVFESINDAVEEREKLINDNRVR